MDFNGQCRPSLYLWIMHDPCMQIQSLSTATEGCLVKKKGGGGLYTVNSFTLFSSGVRSALQNSWEATSLEICWLFSVALCGGFCLCATCFIFIYVPKQRSNYAIVIFYIIPDWNLSCGPLKTKPSSIWCCAIFDSTPKTSSEIDNMGIRKHQMSEKASSMARR